MKNKIFTKQDWEDYKPKSFTPTTYSRLMRKIVDLNTWGWIEKRHLYSTERINLALRSTEELSKGPDDVTIISAAGQIQSKNRHQIEHIKNYDVNIFYVTSLFSNLMMPALDIDPTETTTQKDLDEVAAALKELLPCYIEPSTNGKGLHIYLIIDFTSYVDYYGRYKFAKYANDFIVGNDPLSLISLLRSYINNNFNVHLCGINGYYSQYEWKKFNNRSYLQRTNASCIIKQPKPRNNDQFFSLINLSIISLHFITSFKDTLIDLLNYDTSLITSRPWNVKSTSQGSSDLLPYQSENTDELKTSLTFPLPSFIPSSCSEKNTIKSLNDLKMHSGNAEERVLNSLMKLMREIGRAPNYKEWEKYYIENGCNTGEDNGTREDRFNRALKSAIKTFDPSKCGKIYNYGDFIENIKNDITQERIKEIIENDTNYRYKIKYEDLDIVLGSHWMNVRLNKQPLTVPTRGIVALFKKFKEDGIVKRSCDGSKIIACRIILEHMKYIKIIDKNYDCIYTHTSMKWGMDVNFPKYKDYQLFCGEIENKEVEIKKEKEAEICENILQLKKD